MQDMSKFFKMLAKKTGMDVETLQKIYEKSMSKEKEYKKEKPMCPMMDPGATIAGKLKAMPMGGEVSETVIVIGEEGPPEEAVKEGYSEEMEENEEKPTEAITVSRDKLKDALVKAGMSEDEAKEFISSNF